MSDQETIILIVAVVAAFLALMLLHMKEWKSFVWMMIIGVAFAMLLAYLDTEKAKEPDQTILEQQREKWRDNKEEKINGSRD